MRIKDLYEGMELEPDICNTISPTMVIPELINSDTYKQYRYTLALAAARAFAAGEIPFDIQSAWNESLAVVAYTPEEQETMELANRMMGVKGKMLSKTPPTEPNDTQKTSPVMKFNMFDSMTESADANAQMRGLINLMEQATETPDETE